MAELRVEGDDLVLALTAREKLGGLSGDVRVPLRSVRRLEVSALPWLRLRGWRSSGVNFPGVVSLGSRRHGEGYDFVVLRRTQQALVVELVGQRYGELVFGTDDPAGVGARVAEAAGVAFDPAPKRHPLA